MPGRRDRRAPPRVQLSRAVTGPPKNGATPADHPWVAAAYPLASLERARLELTSAEIADRDAVLRALEGCAGNQTRAAKALGISRTALVSKLRRYRIRRPQS